MSFFSKLFGTKPRQTAGPDIPSGTDSAGLIRIAVQAAADRRGGNCATLTSKFDPERWLQLMENTVNAAYPHTEAPEQRCPKLFNSPMAAGLTFEPGQYVTVPVDGMSVNEISTWIAAYFTEVLSVNLSNNPLGLKMETM